MLSSLFPNRKFIRLDGGMGSMLQKGGMPVGALPEVYNITEPERIIAVQRQFVEIGSDIIYANTFGANRHKMAKSGYSVQELIAAGIACAREACAGTEAKVALDIGPIGQLLEPLGTLTFEEAYDIFVEEIEAGQDADLIVIETMTDLYETKAALLAAKEHADKPVFCTMTFEPNLRTFTGCTVASMAMTLEGLGADAIGVNCSLGPDELFPIMEEMAKWTTLPLIIKPNAGLPDPITGEYLISPGEFADALEKYAELGVTIYGGCCGTTPAHLTAAYTRLEGCTIAKRHPEIPAAVCSASEVVPIDQPRIIGERINPTGKKRFKAALQDGDMDYILDQAVQQVDAGADLLDVNVGMPGIDEKGMMIRTVKALQSIGGTPLQLDSTIPAVLEAALRVYNGKPIVNSVNGEEASLQKVLPLVKKYGAAVVGLTLDENGIPKKAEDRFAIAKRILERAEALGIPKRDVYIDCLTLTASAEQDGARETLKALRRVKEELGLKTVLGVSNISFGLPNREAVTRTFLTMALENGLDLPIINPNIRTMTEAVRAYRLLCSIDKNCAAFVEAYANIPPLSAGASAAVNVKTDSPEKKPEQLDLPYAMSHGLKNEGAKITAQLLEQTDPMEIVNHILIPALDEAGQLFEKGKIFLPQLIQTAGVAQAAFEVIKTTLIQRDAAPVSRGEIVLATVKGDIHDIGKNIVRVLLENYGYTVIDLGRDVPCQLVADTAKERGVKLVGLSALMTTTLGAMEETIQLVKKACPDCKIVVGGAVLTADYAEKIGADFYAKDAMETVAVAKQIIG